jgi:hypothetical protein
VILALLVAAVATASPAPAVSAPLSPAPATPAASAPSGAQPPDGTYNYLRRMRRHAASCCASRVLPGGSTLRGSKGSADATPLPAGDNFALLSMFLAAFTSASSA